MELKIYWTEFSEKELEKIHEYYRDNANSQVAKKIISEIYNETLKLNKQSEIGQIEELLTARKQDFRYLVFKYYKIIYWINIKENRIEINDVFDTRQNPIKMSRIK